MLGKTQCVFVATSHCSALQLQVPSVVCRVFSNSHGRESIYFPVQYLLRWKFGPLPKSEVIAQTWKSFSPGLDWCNTATRMNENHYCRSFRPSDDQNGDARLAWSHHLLQNLLRNSDAD